MNGFGLVALKSGCTTFFDTKTNAAIPVTVLRIANCIVAEKKSQDSDGYSALKIAYDKGDNIRDGLVNKPISGLLKKFNLPNRRYFKEFRMCANDLEKFNIGDVLDASMFVGVKKVDAIGNTKGRGFAGVMKKYQFGGLEASHGVSVSHRSPGSTGQRTDPGKTFKNKKMAGQYGNVQKTIKNLMVVDIDIENNLIAIRGAVPGFVGSFVVLRAV